MARGTAEAVIVINCQKALSGDHRARRNFFMIAEKEELFKNLTDTKQTGGFIVVGYRPKTEDEFRDMYKEPFKRERIPIEFADEK